MAVTITTQVNTTITNAQEALDYIISVYNRPRLPFYIGQPVNIVNRSALPADVGAYNVGYVISCPDGEPVCTILALADFGKAVAVSIPKSHLTGI